MSYKKLYSTPEYTPIDIATDAAMAAVLVQENAGKIYRFTGTAGTYTNGNLYEVEISSPYKFYDFSGVEIKTISISGLADAYYYTKNGGTMQRVGGRIFYIDTNATGDSDTFYVYDTENNYSRTGAGMTNGSIVTGCTENAIGSGKRAMNTIKQNYLSSLTENDIWYQAMNQTTGGCNDGYIGSNAEMDALRNSGLVDWFSTIWFGTSVEYSDDGTKGYFGYYPQGFWYVYDKTANFVNFVAMRSF